MYSVDSPVEQRCASLLSLVVYSHSNSALSGVKGLIWELKSEQHSLLLLYCCYLACTEREESVKMLWLQCSIYWSTLDIFHGIAWSLSVCLCHGNALWHACYSTVRNFDEQYCVMSYEHKDWIYFVRRVFLSCIQGNKTGQTNWTQNKD